MSEAEIKAAKEAVDNGQDVNIDDNILVSQDNKYAKSGTETKEEEKSVDEKSEVTLPEPEPDKTDGTQDSVVSETEEKTSEELPISEQIKPGVTFPQIEVPAATDMPIINTDINGINDMFSNADSSNAQIDAESDSSPSLVSTSEEQKEYDFNSDQTPEISYDLSGISYNTGEDNSSFMSTSNPQQFNFENSENVISKDIKYFKNPNVIPRLMDIIKENISVGVKELIEKEFKRLQEPMMNTSEVGERSYNLADKMIRNGQNLESFNEYEKITDIRKNGSDAANDFTNTTSSLQSFDEFGYIAKDPINMPYIQQTESDINAVENYEPGQNIIKGNFGYGEDQEQSNNLKKVG